MSTTPKKGNAQIIFGGLVKNAKFALPEKNTLTLDASVLGTNTSIQSNAGGYTIRLTGDMSDKKFVGTSKADTLSIAAKNASVESDKNNDKLVGSANNDSLNGGNGNDSLWGGTDTIFDYETSNILQILKSDGSADGPFIKYSFSNNKLTLTIDGGGSVVFDGVKSGDSFNINSTIHTLSGKKLK